MNKTRSLQSLLRDHSISAEEFLSTEGISAQIRSNLLKFVDYCRTHRPFILRMLQLAFNISYQHLEDPGIRTASHVANEIFGNEQNEIAELFFEPPPVTKTQTTTVSEPVSSIQSQAQKLFQFDDEQEQNLPPEDPREVQITGQELVTSSVEILKNPDPNQTCLGHLQKMYSFFIRHEPIKVLEYFNKHTEILQLLFKNIRYSSISTILAQLLTSEDKNKEYKFQSLKKIILQRVIEEVFQNIEDLCFFEGAITFLDEILNVTKQSYYEYFQDFMRISNYLVSQPVLKRFYEQLFNLKEPSFLNSSRFLENLFLRINGEVEDNRYYHKQENQQSMNFQIDIFIKNIPTLLTLTSKFQHCSTIAKIHYLSFLDVLLKNTQAKASPLPLKDPSFLSLFQAYRSQKDGGLCKSKIYSLISNILSKASQDETKQFLEEHKQIYGQYFPTVKAANYGNTKLYNKNQGSAFDISLIAKLTLKDESALVDASNAIGKDLKRMCKKYDIKIATSQNSKNIGIEQSIFQSFDISNFKNSQNDSTNQTLVGKNNISIPTLHLPERFHNLENQGKGPSSEVLPNQPNHSPQEIVEEEEVVSLTNKLGRMQEGGINLTALLRQDTNVHDEDSRWPDNFIIPKQERWEKEQNEDEVNVDEGSFKIVNGMSKESKEMSQMEVKSKQYEKSVPAPSKSEVKVDIQKVRYFCRHLPIF